MGPCGASALGQHKRGGQSLSEEARGEGVRMWPDGLGVDVSMGHEDTETKYEQLCMKFREERKG